MEAPYPLSPIQKEEIKEFKVLTLNKMKLSINCYKDSIQFILDDEIKNGEFQKFGKRFTLDELNRISKWFILFDSINEVFRDIIKLSININIKENIAKLTFKTNMTKIEDFDIVLEKEELSKDEIINNLRSEIKNLKNKIDKKNDSDCCCCLFFILLSMLIFYLLNKK